MPYSITKNKDNSYKVTSPHGTRAAKTSKKNAIKQVALLKALEHGAIKKR